MRIISRSEWGARHDNGSGARSLPARHAVLHHSVTLAPDLIPPFDDDYAAVRALEDIGESRFGRGISYTRLFTPAGLIFEGHSIDRVGSHTAGYNVTGVGYCLIGNYETGAVTADQVRAVAWCLQDDHANGWLDAPVIDFPHSAVKATACPGINGRASIFTINRLALGGPITEEGDVSYGNEQNDRDWATAYRVNNAMQGRIEIPDGPIAGEDLPLVLEWHAAAWRLHRLLQLDPSLPSGFPGIDDEPLPLIDLLNDLTTALARVEAKIDAHVGGTP